MSFTEVLLKDLENMLSVKVSLGFSRNSYEFYVKQFIKFCSHNYPHADCISNEIIREWIHNCPCKNINTQTRRIAAIRNFTKYQATIGRNVFIPLTEYSLPLHKYTPYIFTDYELVALFNATDTIPPYWESPGRELVVPVLFRMMYCCGMRPSEPLNLKCKDISLETGEIYIRQSKRKKDRHLYM